MRDSISEARVKELHPKIRDEVKALIEKAEENLPGILIRVVQGLRTFDEQNKLYAQGRTAPGNRVTNSKAGQSYHNYGLAIDFCLMYDSGGGVYRTLSWDVKKDGDKDGEADWMEVVNVFEKAGYTWGGRFHSIQDNPHLEKNFGINWRQLLVLYGEEKFYPGTQYVII